MKGNARREAVRIEESISGVESSDNFLEKEIKGCIMIDSVMPTRREMASPILASGQWILHSTNAIRPRSQLDPPAKLTGIDDI